MFDYIENVIVECAEDLKNSCSYFPGNNQLFKVNEDSPNLPPEDADLFHPHVARLLSVSKRARPDIQVCVAFLCTRAKSPMEKDYRKIGRVVNYLKETVHLLLVLCADNRGILNWNIDIPFTVRPDCKSCTETCKTGATIIVQK